MRREEETYNPTLHPHHSVDSSPAAQSKFSHTQHARSLCTYSPSPSHFQSSQIRPCTAQYCPSPPQAHYNTVSDENIGAIGFAADGIISIYYSPPIEMNIIRQEGVYTVGIPRGGFGRASAVYVDVSEEAVVAVHYCHRPIKPSVLNHLSISRPSRCESMEHTTSDSAPT